ncbi:vesicle-associated membrane protein 711-like [Tasmannia lanceolata]|uniref:vesicle-associated membrane protein 711-like n=1 Tax=Tasmannia lanceolata TaxID=3420 RepID=UPI0040630607
MHIRGKDCSKYKELLDARRPNHCASRKLLSTHLVITIFQYHLYKFTPVDRRIPFAFLEDIHGRFVKTYGRAVHSTLAYAMNDEFSRVLSQQMEYYSNDPNADRINRKKGEMNQVRNVMIENIDKVLERGDRLELLVDKTTNIQGNTFRFIKQARRFKNTVWWRNVKLTVALIVLLLIIICVVLAFVCHRVTLPSCRK